MSGEKQIEHPTEATVETSPLGETDLFKPIKVGSNTLQNRVVLAPSTRFRATEDHIPSDLQLAYYDARTKTPGTLVITEATPVSSRAGLYRNVPGIWSDKQVEAWKKITDKVHANKSFISIQLWGIGRVSDPSYMKELGLDVLSVTGEPFSDYKDAFEQLGTYLRALTTEEVQDFIKKDFAIAAQNAIKAGFDYVELHNAHGYLLDSFLYPSSNTRTDQYGGSIENRARFTLELVDHLTSLIGADKLAIRLSPWADFQGMLGGKETISPVVTHSYLVDQFQKRAEKGKELAYISLVEPRVSGNEDVAEELQLGNNNFVLDIWKGTIIIAGNFSYDAPSFSLLKKTIADGRTLVGFARYYTSNPDLVEKLRKGGKLVPYSRALFYNASQNWGYNTFTAEGGNKKFDKETEVQRTSKPLV